jgi:hypothetical protein
MTFANTLLRRLAEWHPKQRETLQLTDETTGWTVALTADRCDSLSCQLLEVTLRRQDTPEGTELQSWAGQCAANLRGLPDALAVVEVDALRREALLRSEKPFARDDAVLYFEAHLYGTSAVSVGRFRAQTQTSAKREQVPYVLSHEMLATLVESLTKI